jgi:hypothetical protein
MSGAAISRMTEQVTQLRAADSGPFDGPDVRTGTAISRMTEQVTGLPSRRVPSTPLVRPGA